MVLKIYRKFLKGIEKKDKEGFMYNISIIGQKKIGKNI